MIFLNNCCFHFATRSCWLPNCQLPSTSSFESWKPKWSSFFSKLSACQMWGEWVKPRCIGSLFLRRRTGRTFFYYSGLHFKIFSMSPSVFHKSNTHGAAKKHSFRRGSLPHWINRSRSRDTPTNSICTQSRKIDSRRTKYESCSDTALLASWHTHSATHTQIRTYTNTHIRALQWHCHAYTYSEANAWKCFLPAAVAWNCMLITIELLMEMVVYWLTLSEHPLQRSLKTGEESVWFLNYTRIQIQLNIVQRWSIGT